MSAPVRVVYIAGAGRSGSTLVARILGQSANVVSAGEIRNIVRFGYLSLPDDVRCGCGEVLASCPFWTRVRVALEQHVPGTEIDQLPALLPQVDRIRFLPAVYSPWKTSVFRGRVDDVARLLVAVYRAVLEVGGGNVIVDESKDLSLLFILARSSQVDLNILHLIRDSRAVTNSWMRKKRKPEFVEREVYMIQHGPVHSALSWWYRNLGVEAAGSLAEHYDRIRYEEVAGQPRDHLAPFLEAIGVDGSLDHLDGRRLSIVEPDHLAAGNPMRFERTQIEIRPDEAWRTEMPRVGKSIVTALTWPLLLRYGYRL